MKTNYTQRRSGALHYLQLNTKIKNIRDGKNEKLGLPKVKCSHVSIDVHSWLTSKNLKKKTKKTLVPD